MYTVSASCVQANTSDTLASSFKSDNRPTSRLSVPPGNEIGVECGDRTPRVSCSLDLCTASPPDPEHFIFFVHRA